MFNHTHIYESEYDPPTKVKIIIQNAPIHKVYTHESPPYPHSLVQRKDRLVKLVENRHLKENHKL